MTTARARAGATAHATRDRGDRRTTMDDDHARASAGTTGDGRCGTNGGRFGRGVIRARRRARRGHGSDALALAPTTTLRDVFRTNAIDAHVSAGSLNACEDPPARYPPTCVDAERSATATRDFKAMSSREHQDAMATMMRSQPMVLKRTGVLGDVSSKYVADRFQGLEQTWDFERVASALGASEWECLMCPSSKHKFLVCDASKNAHGSYYHIREPEVETMRCKFEDFVQCARNWREKSILFDAEIFTAKTIVNAEDIADPPPKSDFDQRCPDDFIKNVCSGIDWGWFNRFTRAQRFGQLLSMRLVAGQRDSLNPARYYLEESIHLQVNGRRRILLIPPKHSFGGMYPYPVAHPYDGYSMVDLDDVDYGQTPAFTSVRGLSFVLEPGDFLYIPRGWWRHEQGLSKEHIHLDFRLLHGKRPRARDMAILPVSRSIEERLAVAEGIHQIKHWLKAIAEAEDANWIDLSTVKGHKRIKMTQMVRDEVDLNLGRGSWQSFLRTMIDGRLDPTPWLNISFREPLYLTDKPVHVADTRNELEKEFPEFYVAKLKKEGYAVDYTPVSVFNPTHPETIASVPKP